MIRKFISFAAMAVLMISAGSCQKELPGIEERDANISFTLHTDGQTKAVADATNIDILHYEVYPEDVENAAKPLAEGSVRDENGDGVFTVDLSVIVDQRYNFIFWAQADPEDGKEHYDVSDLRRVGIKTYADERANDESRAAFYAHKSYYIDGPEFSETIYLDRPFAQINVGTTTYEVPSLNLAEPLKVNQSAMKVYGVADAFNTIAGVGEGSQEVLFKENVTPNGDADATDKLLEVKDGKYYWISMNYLIVNGTSDNVKVDAIFYTTHGDIDVTVDNVPVKQNYRTNIIGNMLTTGAAFEVVVDETFQTPDIIVGDEGGSNVPAVDYEIIEDGENITYKVYTPAGLEAWRQAAHEDALKDTERQVNLVLGADIYLEYIEGQANWIPVGTYDHPYDGYVDGAGHSIYNMSIDNEGDPAGFIGAWTGEDGATAVNNIIFVDARVRSSNEYGTGVVIGYGHKNFIIKETHVRGGSVSGGVSGIGGGPCGGLFGGGFDGGFDFGSGSGNGAGFGGTAIDCSNSASVSVTTIVYYVGGIGGYGNAINCINTGSVTSPGYYVGGILGGSNGTVKNNTNKGKVTGNSNVGGIVGGIMDGILEDNENYGDIYGAYEELLGGIYGWIEGTADSGNTNTGIIKVIVINQDYTVKTEPEVTTYTVYTVEGLETWRAAAHQNALDKKTDKVNLVLAADIELPLVEEGSSNWTPVGTSSAPYNGIIDGDGFTISNLTISGGSNIGFIGVASYKGSFVKNLKLANVNVSGTKNVGAVVGNASNDGNADNCHVLSGKVAASGDNVGGIVGYSEYYGGAQNCSNEAEISGDSYVGGISGHAFATRSTNRGSVTGTGNYVAGVYGSYSYGNTTENKNYGDVTGVDNVAGITGKGNSTYSLNEGDITGRDYVAGITPSNSSSFLGNIGGCTNKGAIKGRNNVAGIIEYCHSSLADCINEGTVEGAQYVAGIASRLVSRSGYDNTALTRSENKGEVSGISYVSGIVSLISGTYNCNVVENLNSGNVVGEDKVAAILAYNENANVTYNRNTGNVTGYTDVANFVGRQNPSYSPDTVTGNVSTGALEVLQNTDYSRTVDGTAVSYIVYTQRGFEAWAAEALNSVSEGYVCNLTLETDIVLPVPAEGESNWTPIGNADKKYKGNIDGKNHTISNLTVRNVQSGMGFIGAISSGSIKNLVMENVTVVQNTTNNSNYVGAVAGYADVAIDNCHVLSGTIIGLDDWVGGIAGACEKTVTGCTNKASVTGAEKGYSNNGYVGGITGKGNVTSCINYDTVTGYQKYTGGCTGYGNAKDCQNHGDVTKVGKSSYTGGITGYGDAENCSNTGNVTGYTNVGGITGKGTETNCYNKGEVSASGK